MVLSKPFGGNCSTRNYVLRFARLRNALEVISLTILLNEWEKLGSGCPGLDVCKWGDAN